MYSFINSLLPATLFCILYANSALAIDGEAAATLSLSPQFCITASEEQNCDIELLLNWHTAIPQVVCILSNYQALPKWCADSADIKALSLKVSTQEDIQFILINKLTHQTLAGAQLNITPTAEPQARRRFRNPWSLF
ncbi:DUF3019 domain-containing protein [Shewanella algidipiscicola]|uniref:DUF3019 domain-containing protein n=1 Tax=Shewanella algidipiscicola TaxID=614070 RepID=UPI0020129707|nr:DUF3019 domain-containing protein [Shewanella algidipiscicola]